MTIEALRKSLQSPYGIQSLNTHDIVAAIEEFDRLSVWYSPDTLPNVNRGGSGFFYVAVKRSNGKICVFPAVYLNEMELKWEGTASETVSGNRWISEAGDEHDIASGWFDCKEHADYDDYYQPLLEESDELVA